MFTSGELLHPCTWRRADMKSLQGQASVADKRSSSSSGGGGGGGSSSSSSRSSEAAFKLPQQPGMHLRLSAEVGIESKAS